VVLQLYGWIITEKTYYQKDESRTILKNHIYLSNNNRKIGIDRMTTSCKSKYSLLAGAVLFTLSSIVLANTNANPVLIPMMKNAQVFANFTDDIPAVLNYFSHFSEKEIIEFYQQHYGEAVFRERKRGRLTLSYQQQNQTIRVVISQQNNKRQVDVIVEQTQE